MKQQSSKPSGKKTHFRRLIPRFLKTKEHSHPEPPPNPGGTTDPALMQQRPSSDTGAPSTAVALVDSASSNVENPNVVLNGEEEEERKPLARAKNRLNTAANNLKKKIPADILGSTNFEIKASADITSVAESIGSALVTMMDLRSIEKSRQSHFQGLVTEWAKKTIPFLETGLTAANV